MISIIKKNKGTATKLPLILVLFSSINKKPLKTSGFGERNYFT